MLIQALYKVFRQPAYTIVAFVSGATVFALAVWLPNLPLIIRVMGHTDASLKDKIGLPLSLLGSITTNFSVFSGVLTIAIAILFGINLAMFAYYLKYRVALVQRGGIATGFLGVVSGVLGTGCAACGSFVLMSGFSLVGASGALAILPFGGAEFGLLGVALLIASIIITAMYIQNPAVCSINP
ncbi:hypothetical protein FJY93_02760 [Candidatus Kaiserbacteria bacterium]|nr:hypothetical protein [Candidatus Kaiserbacteria bacterium]